jgi:threonine dehydratase
VIPLDEIRRAREVLDGVALRTPLVRLDADTNAEIWLKLELLQPVRSFKIRGAGSAVLQATDAELAGGVLTASAGNMAQGLSYVARTRGLTATIVVPDHAPQTKIDAIERYGGRVIKVPYDEWWNTMVTGGYPGVDGLFVHPVADDRVMAGNGTIGLELVEQLEGFDAVIVPYGGGGLVTGIASAVKALRPEVRFYSSEPATGAPAAATFAAGGTPTTVEYQPSFVDGSGSRELIPKVWEHASGLLDGAFAPTLDEVAAAVRLIAERTRVIPEGAGALALAAALRNDVGRKVVCVVSGGNIDLSVLARILNGETPLTSRRFGRGSRRCRTASRSSTRPAAHRCRTRWGRRSRTRCARRPATSAPRTRRATRWRRSCSAHGTMRHGSSARRRRRSPSA